jgi:hypothetical protein
MLLIQTEQTRSVMLYHLKLDYYWEGLHPAALRLVDPWCFGSIAYATPVRSESSSILITHSSLVKTPT